MLIIGSHLSAAKGYLHMAQESLSIGANTFQFFTRNPRGFAAKEQDPADVAAFIDFADRNAIPLIMAHAPYTLNACSAEERTRELAFEIMQDDLRRLEQLPACYYNFHPGSHVKQGVDMGVELTSSLLNRILTEDQHTLVLLETMAGKGSEIGAHFEELRAIIDRTELDARLGVCLDTCHVSDGGYDIVGDLDGVLEEFDRIVGLDRLKAVHLNDSKNPAGSRKDRHETLGNGYLGEASIARIINHPKLRDLPFFLETPNDLDGYAREIALLKRLRTPGA